jgi:hypothetical protein
VSSYFTGNVGMNKLAEKRVNEISEQCVWNTEKRRERESRGIAPLFL